MLYEVITIVKRHFGLRHQQHLPVNSAKAPHILIFEIASVAPAKNLYGHAVFPGFYERGDIEFGSQSRSLAITHFDAIDPNVKCGTHPAKMK